MSRSFIHFFPSVSFIQNSLRYSRADAMAGSGDFRPRAAAATGAGAVLELVAPIRRNQTFRCAGDVYQ
jgi:hypothetical protein